MRLFALLPLFGAEIPVACLASRFSIEARLGPETRDGALTQRSLTDTDRGIRTEHSRFPLAAVPRKGVPKAGR